MAKHLHEGTSGGAGLAWAASQRAYEQDDHQRTIEFRTAPTLLQTDGKILTCQNQGRYSLQHLYNHSQMSRPRHQDCKRHSPKDDPVDFLKFRYRFPASVNRDGEKNR
jgi:hypothetical protein